MGPKCNLKILVYEKGSRITPDQDQNPIILLADAFILKCKYSYM